MLQFDPEKQECTKLPRLFYYRYNILTTIAAVQLDSHGYVSLCQAGDNGGQRSFCLCSHGISKVFKHEITQLPVVTNGF